MEHSLIIVELQPDDWQRLRDIRLRSLSSDPHAFGATFESESAFTETQWREMFEKVTFLSASNGGNDVATMSIENLKGDLGTTCWIGGCWVAPEMRGRGVMRAFMAHIDSQAEERRWTRQGLGVWKDNFDAMAAYERLGFIKRGEPQPSTRQPGKFYQRMFRDA